MGMIHHCGLLGMSMLVQLANNSISAATVGLVLEARAFALDFVVWPRGVSNPAKVLETRDPCL
jgi:3-hydroxyisobutyrate dehydrogenase-like beta-hydroxyacid dehydrogenase